MQFSNSKLKLRFLRLVTRESFNFVGKNPLQRMRAQDLLNPGDCEPAPTRTQPCGNACVRAGLFAFLAVVSRTAFCSPREHQWPSGTSDWAMLLWYITVLTQRPFGTGKHGRRASSVRVAWRKIWVGGRSWGPDETRGLWGAKKFRRGAERRNYQQNRGGCCLFLKHFRECSA